MPRPSTTRKKISRKRLLPHRPNLEQLRKHAKDLFRRVRTGEDAATARFRDTHPAWHEEDPSRLGLHDAQWVVAREYGFESWTKLMRHVEHIAGVQRDLSDLPLNLTGEGLVALLAERDWRAYHPVESHLLQNIDRYREAVLAGLEDENPRIRAACAQLMDHGGDDACIEPLRKAMADPVPKVRLRALHSLQCQRCKREPLAYDVVPDMIRLCEQDPSEKVRRGALGGMNIQPPDTRLAHAIEAAIEREPQLGEARQVAKLLRHHLQACSLDDLLERIEQSPTLAVRQASALNLQRHAPSEDAEQRLRAPLERETNEILQRCLERGLQHHAKGG